MSKLEENWKAQSPRADFSGRVLDAWMREEGRAAAVDVSPRGGSLPARPSRIRDVVVFASGFAFAAAAAVLVWIAISRARNDATIRSEDLARAPASGAWAPSAADRATPPVASADHITLRPITQGRPPHCAAPPSPACLCDPKDPLCGCEGSDCPNRAIGSPPRERLDAAEVEEIVSMGKMDLDADCVRPNTKAPADVSVELSITKNGWVKGIVISGADDDPDLSTCVETHASLWLFPKALHDTSARLTLVFGSGSATPTPSSSAKGFAPGEL